MSTLYEGRGGDAEPGNGLKKQKDNFMIIKISQEKSHFQAAKEVMHVGWGEAPPYELRRD